MLFRMLVLQKSSQESGQPLRQVFVSRSQMLVNQLEKHWKKLNGGLKSPPDDRAEGEDRFPPKFSQLDDSHFPRFLTYDRVSATCA